MVANPSRRHRICSFIKFHWSSTLRAIDAFFPVAHCSTISFFSVYLDPYFVVWYKTAHLMGIGYNWAVCWQCFGWRSGAYLAGVGAVLEVSVEHWVSKKRRRWLSVLGCNHQSERIFPLHLSEILVRNLPCSTCVTSVPIHWQFSQYCYHRLLMFSLNTQSPPLVCGHYWPSWPFLPLLNK